MICHGPPLGFGDDARARGQRLDPRSPRRSSASSRGSSSVGHIHPGYGRYRLGETEIINAAYVDNDYQPVNPLVEIEL